MSGGLDSTSLALYMLSQGYEIRAYSFNYGQKHDVELSLVKKNIVYLQSKGYPIVHQTIDLRDAFSDSSSSLHKGGDTIPEGDYRDETMKSTVVENRNVIFSSIIYGKALAWANKTQSDVVITLGLHAGDHCFAKETKILTPDGLKTITELKCGDEVYSWNDDNKCEIDKVTDLIHVGVSDQLYNISTTTGNLRVTPDHKLYKIQLSNFDPSKGYEKKLVQCYAKDLAEGDLLLTSRSLPSKKNTITYDCVDLGIFDDGKFIIDEDSVYIKENKKTPRYVKSEYIVALMAWYITEGWTSKPKKKSDSNYSSRFSQSLWKNFENCENIQSLFTNSGIPVKYEYSKQVENGIPKEITYYISGIVSNMFKTAGHCADEKHIPGWLMKILKKDSNLRKIFINNMIEGDDHYDKISGLTSYISKSHKLIEDMSFIVKLEGYAIKTYRGKSTEIISFGNFNRKSGLVNFGDGAMTKITNIIKEDVQEDIFDITVEKNHNFFAGSLGNILVHNCIYPDCRPESQEMARELFRISNWGSERVDYVAPFITIDKGEVLKKGIEACEKLGIDWRVIYSNTISCYNPDELGRSCGKCGTCVERIEAFEKLGLKDPIAYQDTPEVEHKFVLRFFNSKNEEMSTSEILVKSNIVDKEVVFNTLPFCDPFVREAKERLYNSHSIRQEIVQVGVTGLTDDKFGCLFVARV